MPDAVPPRPDSGRRSAELPLLVALVLLTGWFYFWSAEAWPRDWHQQLPPGYYGLQTAAFHGGHIYLPITPNPELLRLPDPYDPVANAPYRVHDMTLYHGRYYLYFGVTPVLVLLWPWLALTGTYLPESASIALFGFGGFLLGLAILLWVRRRYFPRASTLVVVAGAAVIALGNMVPALVQGATFYQVPMTCAYCFGMLSFYAACRSFAAAPLRAAGWLAAASLAWGLAVVARPNYLFGSIFLLGPWLAAITRRQPAPPPGGAWKLAAAAVLPLGAIGAGILWYNHVRFDSPFEFGMKYQLASFHMPGQKLMAPAHLGLNLRGYLFFFPRWERYFPFILPGESQMPLGALSVFPFFWFALLGPVLLVRARGERRAELGWILGMTAAVALTALLFLGLYFALILRYGTEFILWLALASVLGLLVTEAAARARRTIRGVRLAGALLALAAVGMNLLYCARTMAHPERLAPLARLLDYPSSAWMRLRHQDYGPMRLRVTFPAHRAGEIEPLLSTGPYGSNTDLLYVHYLDDRRVQLGLFHAGLGGPASDPLVVVPGREYSLEVFLGSFCPPPEHPFFAGWPDLAEDGLRRKLSVKLDGRLVFAAAISFYPSSPGDIAVGRNPNGISGTAAAFTGTIAVAGQAPLLQSDYVPLGLRAGQAVEMKLLFPAGRERTSDPLLATGVPGASDLVFVHYLPGGKVAFGLDHWGAGGPLTEAVPLDFSRSHTVTIWVGPCAIGPPDRRFALMLDGRMLIDVDQAFFPTTLDRLVVGINPRHSSAGPMFSGRVESVASRDARVLPPRASRHGFGDVSLVVTFPSGMSGSAEPLVTSGVTGAGDFVYVRYVDGRHVRFGIDHWGIGGTESDPIEIHYDLTHRVEVSLDALRAPGEPRSHRVRVRMDGATVLDAAWPSWPSTPEQIDVGENRIGGSTCADRFTGWILLLDRPHPAGGAR